MARMGRGVEGMMNKAAGAEPKLAAKQKPAAMGNKGPGQERKADLTGAGIVGTSSLGAARMELEKQHPQKHDDIGPHHGGADHVRHMPLAGLKPGKC